MNSPKLLKPVQFFSPLLIWVVVFVLSSVYSARLLILRQNGAELEWWVRVLPSISSILALHGLWIYYAWHSFSPRRFLGVFMGGVVGLGLANVLSNLTQTFYQFEERQIPAGLLVFLMGMSLLFYLWMALLATLRANLRTDFQSYGYMKSVLLWTMTVLSLGEILDRFQLLRLPELLMLIWGGLYLALWMTHALEWYNRRVYARETTDPESLIDDIGKGQEEA